ncbi:hypothetical protein [Deinococcus yunweiensis]|uniref:hypothetical protein n=1 Tax=Deinococcus yunweiensis TaxID=367282 RepID=UPI00398ECEFD
MHAPQRLPADEAVGLDHFEGRTWRGLHHQAALCLVALLFLQGLRLAQPDGFIGKTVPAIRQEVAGDDPRPRDVVRRNDPCCTALFSGP